MQMDLKILCILVISVNANELNNSFKIHINVDTYGESKYLINTSGCKIPWFRVDHNDRDTFTRMTCGKRQVLVRKVTEDKLHFKMLEHFDECCYRVFSSDTFDLVTRCLPIKNDTTIKFSYEYISVHCIKQNETYEDYYAFVKMVEDVKNKTDQSWNVLILGMDTMSRARAYNSLTKTVEYLQKSNWLDYRGFNKVGKNTAPNLIPLLTGKSFDNSSSILSSKHPWLSLDCKSDTYKCNSHIIWHQYQKHGYATAFGEDSVYLTSIFQSHGWKGFGTAPTHHYLRPFFKIGEKMLGGSHCTGKLSSAAQILNYVEDFVNTYKHKKFFGFFWISSHSHHGDQSPKNLDVNLVEFLKRLDSLGVFNNTFVIFMGDHGMQQRPARIGIQAFYEKKLPMFFMFVPPSFQHSHPTQYSNLLLNQKRLVSPYDIHMTLQDILNISDDSFIRRTADGCPMCMSLFQEIPDGRSCSNAAITKPFCSCREMKKISVYEYGAMYSVLKAYEHVRYNFPIFDPTWCTVLIRIHTYSEGLEVYYVIELLETSKGFVNEVVVRKTIVGDSYLYTINSFEFSYCEDITCKRSSHEFRVCEKLEHNVPST